jgi:hypothetical protein
VGRPEGWAPSVGVGIDDTGAIDGFDEGREDGLGVGRDGLEDGYE